MSLSFCSSCGAQADADSTFCGSCGGRLPKSTSAVPRAMFSTRIKVPLILVGSMLFVVGVVALAWFSPLRLRATWGGAAGRDSTAGGAEEKGSGGGQGSFLLGGEKCSAGKVIPGNPSAMDCQGCSRKQLMKAAKDVLDETGYMFAESEETLRTEPKKVATQTRMKLAATMFYTRVIIRSEDGKVVCRATLDSESNYLMPEKGVERESSSRLLTKSSGDELLNARS